MTAVDYKTVGYRKWVKVLVDVSKGEDLQRRSVLEVGWCFFQFVVVTGMGQWMVAEWLPEVAQHELVEWISLQIDRKYGKTIFMISGTTK